MAPLARDPHPEYKRGVRGVSRREFLGLLGVGAMTGACASPAAKGAAQPAAAPFRPALPRDLPPAPTAPPTTPPGLFPLPDLREDRVLGQIAGIRPFRRGQLRLEADAHADWPLFHNYGHGGAGLTTAWGCAHETRRLLRGTGIDAPARVTVVGAGIVGLTSARVLQEAGYRVRIVYRETTPHTVSDVAGGQWAPSLIAWGSGVKGRARRAQVLTDSLRRLRALLGTDAGVREVPNFVSAGYQAAIARMAGEFLPPAVEHNPLPIQGMNASGSRVDTLLIEPAIHMAWLWRELRQGGVNEHRQELQSLAQARAFGDDAAVIAVGMGAQELCQDKAMRPIRGQLVLLEPQDLGYLFSHRGGYLFSRSDAVVLGGTVERDVAEATTTDAARARILANHRRAFRPASRSSA